MHSVHGGVSSLTFAFFRVGKDNKRWKQTARRMWRREQHTFVDVTNAQKVERMIASQTKRARCVARISHRDIYGIFILFVMQRIRFG